jgi:hypothetical protein
MITFQHTTVHPACAHRPAAAIEYSCTTKFGEQVKLTGQHCIPIGGVAEQVRRKSSVDVIVKPECGP